MKVITIIYSGTEVPQELIYEAIKPIMERFASSENVIVSRYNENDLVSMGIKASVKNIVNSSKENEVEQASTYIKGLFRDLFGNKVQLTLGFIEVLNSQNSKLLRNAINIIYENRKSTTTLNKLGIKSDVLDAIVSFKENYNV